MLVHQEKSYAVGKIVFLAYVWLMLLSKSRYPRSNLGVVFVYVYFCPMPDYSQALFQLYVWTKKIW